MTLVKITYYKDNTYVLIQNVYLIYDEEGSFGYISPNATRPEDLIEVKKNNIENLRIEVI